MGRRCVCGGALAEWVSTRRERQRSYPCPTAPGESGKSDGRDRWRGCRSLELGRVLLSSFLPRFARLPLIYSPRKTFQAPNRRG